MLNYYGLPNVEYSGNMNISFIASGLPPGAFTSTNVLSGDVTNSPVPEPTTMALVLVFGLFGLAGYGRRKLLKK